MMKKFSVVRGAVLFLAATALAFTTVSCEDEFDDSTINSRLDDLEEDVSDLQSRVSALESLNSQVSSLSDMVSGLVTVTSVTLNEDGSYTIVLSDDTTFDVPAPASDGSSSDGSEEVTVPVVGLATDESGAYYWTLDGVALTDADGNYIYLVSEAAEAVTPLFQVNAETGELQISVDNGTTYTGTGVILPESCTCVSIFSSVTYDDTYAYFTLADGTEIKVLLAVEAEEEIAGTAFYALSGKQYFAYGETKTVNLAMSGIEKAVVVRPEGWKGSVNGLVLSITAPDEANTYAETEGTVTVIAFGEDGQTVYADINVEIGDAPLAVEVDDDDIAITFDADVASYSAYTYGVAKLSSIDEFDPEAIYNGIVESYPGEYTESVSTSFTEKLGEELDYNCVYVVYALCYTDSYGALSFDDYDNFVYEVYEPMKVTLTLGTVSFNDAVISIVGEGVSSIYYYFDETENYSNGGAADFIAKVGYGTASIADANYEGNLTDFVGADYLEIGTSYTLAVLPYVEGRTDYTTSNIVKLAIALSDITSYEGTAVAAIGTIDAKITSIYATVTPDSSVERFYASYLTSTTASKYSTNEAFLDYFMSSSSYSPYFEETTVSKTGLAPEKTGYIVSVAIGKDGTVGPLQKVEATTVAVSYDETITVSAEATDLTSINSVTFSLSASSDVTQYRYLNITNATYTGSSTYGKGDETTTENYLVSTTSSSAKYTTENTVTISSITYATNYDFFVVGYNASEVPTRMAHVNYTVGSGITIISSDDASYIDFSIDPSTFQYQVRNTTDWIVPTTDYDEWCTLKSTTAYCKVTVDLSSYTNIQQVGVFITGASYVKGDVLTGVLAASASKYITESGEVTSNAIKLANDLTVHYTWQDTSGNWYEGKSFRVCEDTTTEEETEEAAE